MLTKKVEIRIDKKGNFTFQAKEGFQGTSCIEETKDLEIALGGTSVSVEKTDDYFRPDPENPINIKIK